LNIVGPPRDPENAMRHLLLLAACLTACTTSHSKSDAPDAAAAADAGAAPVVHQVSPRPAWTAEVLNVGLAPAPGQTACTQLTLNGAQVTADILAARAAASAKQYPQAQAQLTAPGCQPAEVSAVAARLTAAGITHVASADPAPPPSAAELKTAAAGINQFAVALYAQLRGQKGNLFFSPASIAGALALVRAGAAGHTATALDAALHPGVPPGQSTATLAALLTQLSAGRGDATLNIANRVWTAQRLPLLPGYLATVKRSFGAGAEAIDFAEPSARKTINDWVAAQTQDKIPELLSQGAVGPQTELVLTNAVYFLGTWTHPFDAKATQKARFTLGSGKVVQVPTMHQRLKTRAAQVPGAQVVELTYGKSGDLAFDLILPTAKNGLPALEASLTADKLAGWLNGLKRAEVTLAVPKFAQRSQFELQKPLTALGLGELFTGPDLSAMTASPVQVSAVVHQAFVTVDEQGTEAAAATAVIGTRALMRMPRLTVKADHPFLFAIRDTVTGGVIFMGRVADPR